MGKKIFVSYKYADDKVKNLSDGANCVYRSDSAPLPLFRVTLFR